MVMNLHRILAATSNLAVDLFHIAEKTILRVIFPPYPRNPAWRHASYYDAVGPSKVGQSSTEIFFPMRETDFVPPAPARHQRWRSKDKRRTQAFHIDRVEEDHVVTDLNTRIKIDRLKKRYVYLGDVVGRAN